MNLHTVFLVLLALMSFQTFYWIYLDRQRITKLGSSRENGMEQRTNLPKHILCLFKFGEILQSIIDYNLDKIFLRINVRVADFHPHSQYIKINNTNYKYLSQTRLTDSFHLKGCIASSEASHLNALIFDINNNAYFQKSLQRLCCWTPLIQKD